MFKQLPISIAVMAVCITLSGCETAQKNKNTIFGSIVGAASCAAVAKIAGGNDHQVLAAAAVCAVVGAGISKQMEDDRKKYESDEEFYRAESARLKTYNNSLQKQISATEAELQRSKVQIAKLTKKSSRSSTEQAKLQSYQKTLNSRKKSLSDELKVAEENRDYQKGLVARMKETEGKASESSQQQLAALDASVQELSQLIEAHEQQSASLGAYL